MSAVPNVSFPNDPHPMRFSPASARARFDAIGAECLTHEGVIRLITESALTTSQKAVLFAVLGHCDPASGNWRFAVSVSELARAASLSPVSTRGNINSLIDVRVLELEERGGGLLTNSYRFCPAALQALRREIEAGQVSEHGRVPVDVEKGSNGETVTCPPDHPTNPPVSADPVRSESAINLAASTKSSPLGQASAARGDPIPPDSRPPLNDVGRGTQAGDPLKYTPLHPASNSASGSMHACKSGSNLSMQACMQAPRPSSAHPEVPHSHWILDEGHTVDSLLRGAGVRGPVFQQLTQAEEITVGQVRRAMLDIGTRKGVRNPAALLASILADELGLDLKRSHRLSRDDMREVAALEEIRRRKMGAAPSRLDMSDFGLRADRL